MAGTSNPRRSAWPHGEGALIPIRLSAQPPQGDTSGFLTLDVHQAQFDFNVRKAQYSVQSASVAITNGIQLRITDDTGTPQTIVSAVNITAANDDGTIQALTVNDAGPILTGAEVKLEYDSGTSDTCLNLNVTLWVEPIYR